MTVRLSGTPTLETQRLILRAPEAGDYPAWESFYLSPRATFIGGGPELDAGRAWRAFAALVGHWALRGYGVFALVDRRTGQAIGGCGPWFPELWPEREISWTLWRAKDEGQGFMTEAAQAVLPYAFDVLNWQSAVSYIDPANARSAALAERLGAVRDADAAYPGKDETLVYRHPCPDADGGMAAYA